MTVFARRGFAAVLLLAAAGPAGAEALRFTVRPSGTEEETLDARLARRDGASFRFICVGCLRPGSRDSGEGGVFEPLRTLNAPGLAAALAVAPIGADIGQ